MHTNLGQALGRQPRLNRVGQSILNIGGDASAAYSLRSLTGGEPKAVRIRRDGDNEERDFTTAEIGAEAAAWTNGKQETTLPADLPSTSSSITGFTISGTTDNASGTYTTSGTLLNGKLFFKKTGANDEQVRYDGSKWLLWDDDEGEAYYEADRDTEFPWDVQVWQVGSGNGGTPVFSNFVGGNPDNSAAAAYSLRKVRSTYTGPAVRIRRASDNVEVNVSFDTNDEVSTSSAITNLNASSFPSGVTSFTVSGTDSQFNSTFTLLGSQLNGKNQYVHSSESTRKIRYRSDGKWELDQDGDQYQVSVDVGRDYPWNVVDWVQGPEGSGGDPVFSNLVGPDSGDTTATTLGEFLTENIDITNRLIVPSDVATRFVVTSSTDASNYTVSINNGSGEATFSHMRSGLFSEGHYRLRGTLTASNLVGDIKIQTNGGLPDNTQFVSITNGTNNLDFEFDITGDGSTTSAGSVKLFFFINDVASATLEVSNLTWEVTTPDAAVHTWYDQSGNSKNATQTTDANQPLIAENGNLLTAGIKFDGTDDFLATGQSVITQSSAGSFSYFAVSTIATDEGGYLLGSAGNGSNVGSSIYAQNDSKFSLSSGFNLLRDNITRSSGENLLSACYTGGRANFRVDGGGTSVTAGTFDFNANANFTIANRENGSSAATFLAGSTKEIIAYDSDQTNNRFKIESNINNHYTIYTAAQNGFVHTWYDQSGNGFNAVADADVNEPKIVNSGSLLTDGLKFSLGNNLKLSGTGLDIFKNIQYAQIFYAIKINDTSTSTTGFFEARNNSSQARFLLRNSNATAGRISLGGRRLDSDSFSAFQSDSGHSNEKVVLTGFINYSDTDAFIFKNGTQIGSDTSFLTAGATSDTRSTIIAIGRAGANLTAEFDAEELIIFNTDQTANRTAIETNIANEYGITLS